MPFCDCMIIFYLSKFVICSAREVFLLSQLAPLSKLVVWERDYSPIDKDMYIYSGSDAHRQTLDRLKKLDLEMVTNEK